VQVSPVRLSGLPCEPGNYRLTVRANITHQHPLTVTVEWTSAFGDQRGTGTGTMAVTNANNPNDYLFSMGYTAGLAYQFVVTAVDTLGRVATKTLPFATYECVSDVTTTVLAP
jgi:hypothetical protein